MVSDQETPRIGQWDGGWPQTLSDFERLVEAFQDRLVGYAFRRLGNLHDAEDVVQDVFVRAYHSRTQRKTVTCVSAYLYRMVSNLATTLLRKRKRQGRSLSLNQVETAELSTNNLDGLQAVAASEELRRVETFLCRLPHRQAEVIRLRVFDELLLREIAEVIGCPLGTVKSRWAYGLEQLRQIILQEPEAL